MSQERRLVVFEQISLDGYFSDPSGDMSWAHRGHDDAEWNAYVAGNARSGGALLFGRKTYELMASYWPTPVAAANDPIVAERMNQLPKVVFSRTLERVSWRHTRLAKGDLTSEVRRLKSEPGEHIALMGSGSIVSQLTDAGLVDEYIVVVNPIVLGRGKTMFESVQRRAALELTSSRAFANGNVVLTYQPSARSA